MEKSNQTLGEFIIENQKDLNNFDPQGHSSTTA